ncbi:response regulator [Dongia soli]|uniref:Response regulator n=1 Tax=Dongia soli TaxID=600628 RepID=A0ABU5EEI0_9PROT|nr:response regulator [Dongia soli]MDY0884490.1 response regulator [Dongia soli]
MLRILLVEDERLLSTVTSVTLEDAGYHVTVAFDGQNGFEIALQDRPELIITDFMMPRMTGLEMTAKLRQHGFAGPIVLTTSVPEAQLPGRNEYNAYLAKPYTESQLLKILDKFIP